MLFLVLSRLRVKELVELTSSLLFFCTCSTQGRNCLTCEMQNPMEQISD